jgi:hypothetical protein
MLFKTNLISQPIVTEARILTTETPTMIDNAPILSHGRLANKYVYHLDNGF